jgi:Uma2 family endonuclease
MIQATRRLTFEEYANLDAEDWVKLGLPEGRCEYVDEWELLELPSESELNDLIAHFIYLMLVRSGLHYPLARIGRCEIEVADTPRTRYPDLVVLQEEHLLLRKKRLLIRREMAPPQLVVEIVSPGKRNHKRDYEAKREQYQTRGIPEFWLIDPEKQIVTVLFLNNRTYSEVGVFSGDSAIESPTFPDLKLTAHQILTAGEES